MSRRHLRAAPILLVLAVPGCGGSGGPTLSDYKSGFKTEKANFRQLNKLRQRGGAPSPPLENAGAARGSASR